MENLKDDEIFGNYLKNAIKFLGKLITNQKEKNMKTKIKTKRLCSFYFDTI
jgi:hypothetical protein